MALTASLDYGTILGPGGEEPWKWQILKGWGSPKKLDGNLVGVKVGVVPFKDGAAKAEALLR